MKQEILQSELKTLGLTSFDENSATRVNDRMYSQYIKVLFLNEGYQLQVDLVDYTVTGPSLFFVAPNQHLTIKKAGTGPGYLIFYNQDFYCIQIHDKEVACDGLLFNNVQNMPKVALAAEEVPMIEYLFEQMTDEFRLQDSSLEEMLRTYLKQLFIKSVRLWKKQNLEGQVIAQQVELDFFRRFTFLVDEHYKTKHNVADYAGLLFMAPKTIAHKFKRLALPQPNDIIKNRIVLEAKRLLAHTSMTAKEIGYELGYDDPAYFNRMFTQKTGETPAGFRAKYLSAN